MASGSSGVKKDAFASYGTATGQSNDAFNVANPIYKQMATRPNGYLPQEVANLRTASNQTLGGANSAVAGEGALAAARTNNVGAYQAAIDDSTRNASVQQSENNLGILNRSADLQREQQQQGLEGLSNEYGTAGRLGQGYLDLANRAQPTFWQTLGTNAANDALAAATSWGMKPPASGCWIAEAIYGEDDCRTHVVRAYLNGPFRDGGIGDFVMRLYLRFGERIARVVKKSKLLKALFRPFFDAALSSALERAFSQAREGLTLDGGPGKVAV